ncbi:C6 transcription factor [Fusarium globosum]|uniref:C6 transcription factor n=1 Tax=Fusarium globosum TaxID=78864 RepID=A0A8H5XJN8_9HYPO|nr:C6 transcription factor [Fusarium globosum]
MVTTLQAPPDPVYPEVGYSGSSPDSTLRFNEKQSATASSRYVDRVAEGVVNSPVRISSPPTRKRRGTFLEKTLLDLQDKTQSRPTTGDSNLASDSGTHHLIQELPSRISTTYNHPTSSSSGDRQVSRTLRCSDPPSPATGTGEPNSSRSERYESSSASEDGLVHARSTFDSSSTDHFMDKVRRVSMVAHRLASPPLDDRSLSGISGYFRDNLEEQLTKKPSILSQVDGYGKSAISPNTMQAVLTAYWERVHVLHPILHRPTWRGKQQAEAFVRGSAPALDPFGDSIMATTMANLVFALGALYSPGYTPVQALNVSETFFLSAKEALTLDVLEAPSLELAQNLLLMTHYAVERCHHKRGHLHASLLYLSLTIRVCTALGLHEDSGANQGSLARELSRRIWWECIYTDITLSTHYGQRLLLPHPNHVPLPLTIEDEFIFDDRVEGQPSDGTTGMTFFVKAMDLIQIVRDIKGELYSHREDTQRSYQAVHDTGDYRVLRSLESRLLSWHSSLPPELVYTTTPTSRSRYTVQAICLYLRYHYASMLIYRPALSSLLELEPLTNAARGSQSPVQNRLGITRGWQQTLLVQHARSCVAVAVDFIYKIHGLVTSKEEFSIFHGHTWTLFLWDFYSMISVLIATKCCRQDLYPRDEFREAWKQVTNILRRYRTSSDLVEIPFRFLEHTGRRYFESPAAENESAWGSTSTQEEAQAQASSSFTKCGSGAFGSIPHMEGESSAAAMQSESALESMLSPTSWEPPWITRMDDRTFELLADPWEAWDLQWLDGFPDLDMLNSS